MCKLFVSLPMRGREEIDILKEMEDIKNVAELNLGDKFDLINSYDHGQEPDDIASDCWYLGQSISKMATADLVAFSPAWRSANGCIIEHMVCAFYDIPYVEVRMMDLMDISDEEFDEDDEIEEEFVEDVDEPELEDKDEEPATDTE